MFKKIILLGFFVALLVAGMRFFGKDVKIQPLTSDQSGLEDQGKAPDPAHPLSIASLREGKYPGSEITIEETLSPGSNYTRYLASYKSEGNKIYALLTVPTGIAPENGWPASNASQSDAGWPVIIFNHGYIAPSEYRTTERYIAYTDAFSRNGYVLFRPDYRGHGDSEGQAVGEYGSNGYTIDVLNAVASLKRLGGSVKGEEKSNLPLNALPFPLVNPERIGMWGHSMGGHITLRAMVVNKDIKAGDIWAGVVASYPDLISRWRRGTTTPSPFPTTSNRGGWRQGLIVQFGTPEENPEFWASISSNTFLSDISGPVQLQHGTADTSVPVEFSEKLAEQLKTAGKEVTLYTYPGDDHNLSNNLSTALNRSVEFFNKHLK